MRVVAVAVAVVAWGGVVGCYQPSVAACQYACAGTACPDGLTCNAQNMCVEALADRCGSGSGDGGMMMGDGGGSGDAGMPLSCVWGFTPSNVDQCSIIGGPSGDWIVNAGATFNTDQPGSSGDAAPAQAIHLVAETGGTLVAVVYVNQLSVAAGATITVTGSRPLIILADTSASVLGSIDMSATSATCAFNGTAGGPGENVTLPAGAGGGGGGSYGLVSLFATVAGSDGGPGGASGGSPGGNAGGGGNPIGDTTLVPIQPGCPGGKGGSTSAQGGLPGFGGGAIQISTRTTLTVGGQIRVSGGGGGSRNVTSPGGGGGGSGGAILLEGKDVALKSGSFLCANGGGGGAALAPANGENGKCSTAAAKGAAANASGGDGETATSPAVVGLSAAGGGGGGGGGGGVGIIRANGAVANNGTQSPRLAQ